MKKMKKTLKLLSILMAICITVTSLNVPVFARNTSDFSKWRAAEPLPRNINSVSDKRKRFLKIAESQIGYISNNADLRKSVYSKFIMDKLGIKSWKDKDQQLWCTEFFEWCLYYAGIKNWKPATKGKMFATKYKNYFYLTENVKKLSADKQKILKKFTTKTTSVSKIVPGDFIEIEWDAEEKWISHTAIAEKVDLKRGIVYVIEGNSSMKFFKDKAGVLGKKNKIYACNYINPKDLMAYYKDPKTGKLYLRNISECSSKYLGVRRHYYKLSDVYAVGKLDFS